MGVASASKRKALIEVHHSKMIEMLESYTEFDSPGGAEPNMFRRLRIHVNGQDVGILSHEYSILTKENMEMYLEDSHEFVPGTVAENKFSFPHMEEEEKTIYGAALLDGCTPVQAVKVLMGEDPQADFPPPIGHYRMKPNYYEYFRGTQEAS